MAGSLVTRLNVAIQRLEFTIASFFQRRYPPDAFCLAGFEPQTAPRAPISLKDIIGDGLLWAVPKHRRSLEKRHKRMYGSPEYVEKIIKPNQKIRTCTTCGGDHLAGVLCPACYKKVIDETKAMQDAIQGELQLTPVEQEVVVLYDGEKEENSDEFYKGKRVVEMKKSRPEWFSKNLLQQTTQQPATTSDVKPSDLG